MAEQHPHLKSLTNPYFAFGLFAFSVLVGVLISVVSNDWVWFSRFGAIASTAGALASLRAPMANFEPGLYHTKVYNEADDPVWVEHNVEEEERNLKWLQNNKRISLFGVICLAVGALIWGFGDLVGKIV